MDNQVCGNGRHGRPKIAVISDVFTLSYPFHLWQGMAAAANARGADIFYVAGGPLGFSADGEPMLRSALFSLVGPQSADAVIIVSSLLNQYVRATDFLAFCRHYAALPLVSVGLTLPGIPSIVIENYAGVYAEVSHLIEAHGLRRIACIRGPEGHEEAEERFRGYAEALAAHGLDLDPALVAPGRFTTVSGEEAVAVLLDQRRATFDGLVAASDKMALGAMAALEQRGVRIPTQVALAGFDDVEDARWTSPPLTSVRQPYGLMGARALDLVLARLRGEDAPAQTRVPAECVLRESCGCRKAASVYARAQPAGATHAAPAPAARMPDMLADIARAGAPHPDAGSLSAWLEALLSAFFEELADADADRLLPTLDDVLRQARQSGGELDGWQHVVSVLRRYAAAACETAARQLRAEHLWQQARLLIDARSREAQEAREAQTARAGRQLNDLGRELLSTFEMARIMDALAARLPQLGICSGYVALYDHLSEVDDSQPLPPWSRLALAYDEQGRLALPSQGLRFPTAAIVPPDIRPAERARAMVVEALYFQREQIGFAVFEVGARDGITYNTLRHFLSTALQGTLLVERVQAHAHELAIAYEEIRILNDQLQKENLRMGAELSVARRLQEMILPRPDELCRIDGLDIVGYMQPADEVGGDYYDILEGKDILHVGIGDVTGHGLESGVLMLMTQTVIRTLIEHGETDPIAFVNTLNRTIYKNARRMQADKTLTFALVNYRRGQLTIVGQHEDLLVVRQSGQVERIDTVNLGFPIGLEADIAHWLMARTVTLEPGDGVVLYTDGIPEAANAHDELYGLERLCAVVSRHWSRSADAIKCAVVEDITRFIGAQKVYDDLTLVVLKQTA